MPKKKNQESRSRKTSTNPTWVYPFGVPTRKIEDEVKKIIDQELFLANQYRNALTSIERKRRDQYRKLLISLSPYLKDLCKQYDKADNACQEARKSVQSRNHIELRKEYLSKKDFVETPEAEKIKELDAERKRINDLIRAEKDRLTEIHFSEGNTEFKRRKMDMIKEKAIEKDPSLAHRPDNLSEKDYTKLLDNAVGPQIKKLFPPTIRAQMCKEEQWDDAWKTKEKFEQAAYEEKNKTREKCGCSPGTYMKVEKDAERSFKDSIYQPEYVPFNHSGMLGVQITKVKRNGISLDVTVKDMLEEGKCSRVQISMCPNVHIHGYDKAKRRYEEGKRKDKAPQAAIATIKLEKDEKGKKGKPDKKGRIIQIPFVMHREFPDDAVVKWVYLKATKIGLRIIYQLLFWIESETFLTRPEGKGLVAIRGGWRLLKDGDLQVAVTEDGKTSNSLVLPNKMLDKRDLSRLLQSYSDKHFKNVMTKVLPEWLDENAANIKIAQKAVDAWYKKENRNPPKWAKDLKATMPKWKAHGKLAILTFALNLQYVSPDKRNALWKKWKEERLECIPKKDLYMDNKKGEDPEDTSFPTIDAWLKKHKVENRLERLAIYLEWWRLKDKHLVGISTAIQHRLRLQRQDIYRKWAISLARKYEKACISKTNKQKMAKKPKPERDVHTPQEEAANALRQFCGVSILEDAIKHAFSKHRVIEIKAESIPSKHYNCGGTIESVQEGDQHGTCNKCGRQTNRDANSALQLWATCREQSGGGKRSVVL